MEVQQALQQYSYRTAVHLLKRAQALDVVLGILMLCFSYILFILTFLVILILRIQQAFRILCWLKNSMNLYCCRHGVVVLQYTLCS